MSILGKFTGRYDKSRELFCVSVAASSPPNTNRIFEFIFVCLIGTVRTITPNRRYRLRKWQHLTKVEGQEVTLNSLLQQVPAGPTFFFFLND